MSFPFSVVPPNLGDSLYKVPLFERSVPAGFPSPASDYMENALNLNDLLVKNPPTTFFARIADPDLKDLGLYPNDLIIVDRSLKPSHGKLVLAVINGELKIKKFARRREKDQADADGLAFSLPAHLSYEIWGVITYVIHPL